jgi:long-chain fatty acid transport protein
MRSVRFSICVTAMLLVMACAVFAGGFDNTAVGAKARAMGGAFRAIADDWSAAFYNPAGYASALDNQLGGNWAFVHHRHELTADYNWGGTYPVGMSNNELVYNDHQILSNPSAGFMVRLPVGGKEAVFGLSAYQPFDYNITWAPFQPLRAYNDSISLPSDQYRSNLDVVVFQLTAAQEFYDGAMALGVGLQLMRADLVYRNIIFRDHPLKGLDPAYIVDVLGLDPTMMDRPYDKIPQLHSNDGKGWGFGFRGGLMWHASDKLNVGLTGNIPFSVTVSGEVLSEFYMPRNQTLARTSDQLAISIPGYVGNLFVSGNTVQQLATFETKLKLPPSFGLGLAFDVSEKFTLAFDLEYTFWSKFKGFDFDYSAFHGAELSPSDTASVRRDMATSFFESDLDYPIDWSNTAKYMLGLSYDLSNTLTFLAGAGVDQSPIDGSDQFTPLFVDTGDKFSLNGGIQLHIDRWDLGLASTWIQYPDLTIDTPADFGQDEDFVTFPGDYSGSTFETVLSFNYRY